MRARTAAMIITAVALFGCDLEPLTPPVATATCSAELDVDPRHCGSCDRDCGDATCNEGVCGALVVAHDGFLGMADLFEGTDDALVFDPLPAMIAIIAKRNATKPSVVLLPDGLRAIATRPSAIYVAVGTMPTRLGRVDLAMGIFEDVAPPGAAAGLTGLFADDDKLYWTYTGGRLGVARIGGNTFADVPFTGPSNGFSIADAVDGGDVIIARAITIADQSQVLLVLPKDGSSPQTIDASDAPAPVSGFSANAHGAGVLASGDDLFAFARDQTALLKLGRGEGVQLATTDATHAYWIEETTARASLWRIPLGGGVREELWADATARPRAMVVDSASVFLLSESDALRVAK